MYRIDKIFKEKSDKDLLSVYFTAGYPNLNDTESIIESLTENGVDMIEIGIPFSDPMADGVVIQNSSNKALKNGMNLELLFSQLKDIRLKTNIPLLLMGYLNPILYYGLEKFCEKCNECGIDGLIIPDLPMDFYPANYQQIIQKYNLKMTMLITPDAREDTILKIDDDTDGII